MAPALAEAIGLAVGDGCLVWTAAGEIERPMIILTMHADEAGVLEAVAVELNDQKRTPEGRRFGRAKRRRARLDGRNRIAAGLRISAGRGTLHAVRASSTRAATSSAFKPAVYGLDRASAGGAPAGPLHGGRHGRATQARGASTSASTRTSLELLEQVQRLLLGFGIKSKLYENRRGGKFEAMPAGRPGRPRRPTRSRRCTRFGSPASSRVRFEREIGFMAEQPQGARSWLASTLESPRTATS